MYRSGLLDSKPTRRRWCTDGAFRLPPWTLRGQLLVAAPSLIDPNFRRTVVLILEHTDEGALGLVLNRPTDVTAGDAVPELAPLVGDEGIPLPGRAGQRARSSSSASTSSSRRRSGFADRASRRPDLG
jgi:hypothetical protein